VLTTAILAGGLGTRLRALSPDRPKALVPVLGRPFLDLQLAQLAAQRIERVVLCLSYLGAMIEEHVGDGSRYGLRVTYSHDGPEQVGTAGAIKNALPLLGDRFFVIYGDSYLTADYRAIQAAFERSGKAGLMTIYRNENALAPSNVRAENGCILAYEKAHPLPDMHYIDYGLSAYRACAFDTVRLHEPTDLATVTASLLSSGELAGFEVADRFYEVGTPDAVAQLEAYLRASSAAT